MTLFGLRLTRRSGGESPSRRFISSMPTEEQFRSAHLLRRVLAAKLKPR